MMRLYPTQSRERDRWILARRGDRNRVDFFKPYAFLVEVERSESGEALSTATVFLSNRECPWHCLMCDLWKNTLTETVPAGAIPAQIDYALSQLAAGEARSQPAAGGGRNGIPSNTTLRQIKLYNSGSFFDPRAIPPEDYGAIADRVRAFERVVVECHPAFVGRSAPRFRDLLLTSKHQPTLEVGMGLETAHPDVLEKLNKRMTLDQFRRSAAFLCKNDIALRVFVLVKPPFLGEVEALEWAERSIAFAFDCGATVVSLIPTRAGNGALDALAASDEFSPPKLATLEAALDCGIQLKRGRVFADLWDLQRFSACSECFDRRRARLAEMNLGQVIRPRVACDLCREHTA